MIEEIEVFVKGRMFVFKNKDYTQEELEVMWEMLITRMGTDKILCMSPHGDVLIKATSIDFANKIYDYEESMTMRRLILMKDREYREAWNALKDAMLEEYPSVDHEADVSNGDAERGVLSAYEKILKQMDQLDGTHEFSNILHDMNRSD